MSKKKLPVSEFAYLLLPTVNFIEKSGLSIPTDFKVTKVPDENFYYMFDPNSNLLTYVNSLKISVDKLMMEEKMEMWFHAQFANKS